MINVSSSPGRNNDNSDDRYQRRDCLIDALLEMIKKCRLINGIHQQSLQVYYSYQPTQAKPKLSFTRFFKNISGFDMRCEIQF